MTMRESVVDVSIGLEEGIGFPDGPDVDVREVSERGWDVLAAFEYRADWEHYIVPVGEFTDFASVPRPFVWFIPTYGRYTKAAILHDHLCRLAKEGRFNRRDADGVFRQAMRTLGVAFLRRWIHVGAGAVARRSTPTGRKGWSRDAWLVIPITVLVLPYSLTGRPPRPDHASGLYVVELIAWVPRTGGSRTRARGKRPAKRVNTPRLTMRL